VVSVPVSSRPGAELPLDQRAADEARDPLARLQLIYGFSDRIRGCLDLQKLAGVLLDTMMEVLKPDRAALLLTDAESGEMKPFASRTASRDTTGACSFRISRSTVRRALDERATIVIRDTSTDRAVAESESVVFGRIGSIVCIPLVSGDDVYGLIYLDVLTRSRDFPRHTLELLGGIASQAALAVGNCLHHLNELRNRDVQMQLDVAHRIHNALVSGEHFETETLEAFALSRPSARVGGDYYGFFPTHCGPLFTISDGTGHGVGAALIMSTGRAYLKAVLSCADLPLAGIMSLLNSLLCEDLEPGLFVSSLLMRFEEGGRLLRYVMAGHEPPLLFRASRDCFIELQEGGLVLGLAPGQVYEQAPPVETQPGDRILLFTDGVIEQTNSGGEEFGMARLRDAFRESASKPLRECVESIADCADAWRGEIDQSDDLTMLMIELKGS